MEEKIEKYIKALKNAKLLNITRIVDMTSITFEAANGNQIYFNISSIVRIVDESNMIILSNLDVYKRNPDYKKRFLRKFNIFKRNANLFDVSVSKIISGKNDYKIKSAKYYYGDIEIQFFNNHKMDVFRISSIYDDQNYAEDYFIGNKDMKIESVSFPEI